MGKLSLSDLSIVLDLYGFSVQGSGFRGSRVKNNEIWGSGQMWIVAL